MVWIEAAKGERIGEDKAKNALERRDYNQPRIHNSPLADSWFLADVIVCVPGGTDGV